MTFANPFQAPFSSPFSPKLSVTALFDPSSISGLIGWFDFSDSANIFTDTGMTTPVASDGDLIAAAKDKSGSAHHYTQSNSLKRPTWKTAIKNGRAIGRGNGTSAQLIKDPWTGLAVPLTFICVASRTTTSGTGTIWGAQPYVRFDNAGRISMSDGTLLQSATSVYTTNTFYILSFVFNGASSAIYKNGSSLASGAAGSSTVTFTALFSAYDANYLSGDIGEIYVYNSALSDANRQACENGLNTKWAAY